ncbi:MAG TPA: TrmH family RNA methyltransferase [Candidatus Saccharimonadales bacterium]|nr:TrmH family RNA methyltransferase [Candidatus Saccharimonadales bacterium]
MISRDIVVIAHDIRSTHNVGSLLRTCEGLGISKVYLTGYTPYPALPQGDSRLPHIAQKLTAQIHKTALDAETLVPWEHSDGIAACIARLRADGYAIAGLEQSERSTPLHKFAPPGKIAVLLGREVEGIDPTVLALCDMHIEIPMLGRKESFNVVQAAAMALYHLRFGK